MMCDIEAMFYQVKVPEECWDFLHFLWRDAARILDNSTPVQCCIITATLLLKPQPTTTKICSASSLLRSSVATSMLMMG